MSDKQILLLEDEPDVGEIYEIWLSDYGDVVYVQDGADALNKVRERSIEGEKQFDYILSDRRISGGMSGDEFVAQICNDQEIDLDDTEITMVSAVDNANHPDGDLREDFFDRYITKPFRKDDVEKLLE